MYNTFDGLEEFATFIPEDDNSYLDIVEYKLDGQTKLHFATESLNHADIGAWLLRHPLDSQHTGGDTDPRIEVTWTFRLLIGSPAMRSVPGFRHYPFTRAVFGEVADAFRLPPAFIGSATAQVPLATQFRTSADSSGLLVVLNRRAFVVTHNVQRQTTTALALGLCPHEIDKFVMELRSSVCLNAAVIRVSTAWMNVMTETRARRLVERKVAATALEIEADMHWSEESRLKRTLRDLDFEAITRKLSILLTQLAFDEVAIDQVDRLVDKLKILQIEYVRDCCQPTQAEQDAFKLPFEQAQELLFGLRMATKQIVQRTNVQLQTIFSLVAQRDNDLSLANARYSQKIAEATKEDSAVMKQLAKDSKELAKRTYLDSVSMRLMAVVNLCTMPGTFTATLFSTSFFDFKPSSDDSVVSGWVWLYWAITIALTTMIVIPLWIINRKTTQSLERADALEPRKSTSNRDEDTDFKAEGKASLGLRTSSDSTAQQRPVTIFNPPLSNAVSDGISIRTTQQHFTAPIIVATAALSSAATATAKSSSPRNSQTPPPLQTQSQITTSQLQTTTTTTMTTTLAAVVHPLVPSASLPIGSELSSLSLGKLISGPLAIEEGSLFHTPGLRFERSCRVCANPSPEPEGCL